MKVIRSMVLVSVDETSLERGAQDVFRALLDEIDEFGLSDQVAVTTIREAGIHADTPIVIVYPMRRCTAPSPWRTCIRSSRSIYSRATLCHRYWR